MPGPTPSQPDYVIADYFPKNENLLRRRFYLMQAGRLRSQQPLRHYQTPGISRYRVTLA